MQKFDIISMYALPIPAIPLNIEPDSIPAIEITKYNPIAEFNIMKEYLK